MNIQLLVNRLFAGFLLCSSVQYVSVAQKQQPQSQSVCGTELSATTAKELKQKMLTFKKKVGANSAFTTLTYIPVRPHIIRKSDGSGGFELSGMNEVMAMANKYYMVNGLGIQFYFAGESVDYIDNDDVWANFAGPPGPFDVPNALNQYYVHKIQGDYGGLASFPSNNVYSTESFIAVDNTPNVKQVLGNYIIPHEFGHNFGLYHTFGGGSGESLTTELVTRGPGANCETAGDFICDTPADPFTNQDRPTYNFDPNGCFVYDPANTVRDANGEPYNPSLTNIMSYWAGTNCTHDFTAGQYDHIQQALALRQSHTAYTLDYGPTPMTPPSNLSLTFALSQRTVTATWQDNSSTELGYFIERATSPSGPFIPVGGVAPNVTTFTDTQVPLDVTFYYRIRPSNTITAHLSPTVTINTTSCAPVQSTSPSPARTSAVLNWYGNFVSTYNIRWRVAGATEWTTVNGIASGSYSLTGLTAGTTYEWGVQSVCSATSVSAFVQGQTFTTFTCLAPYFLGTTGATSSSAGLYWYLTYGESGRTYELRYRPTGAPNWNTISGISSQSYSLTGLTNNTAYEWQVKSVCSPTESSTFTASSTFTTTCRVPNVTSSVASQTRARLQWSAPFPSDAQSFQLRYRPIGNPNWITVTTSIQPVYDLSGLTSGTTYEWEVASVCSASAVSDFSTLTTFTTGCSPIKPQDLNATNSMSSSVRLNWFATADPGTLFTLRYRPISTPTWTTVSNLTAITNNGVYTFGNYDLTGLTPGTSYEWEMATACSPTQSSTFTPGPPFPTLCSTPVNLYPTVFVTSAYLYWDAVGPGATYEARYRLAGTPNNWTTITNINSTTVTLTGLSSNSAYDWEVRTICGNTSSSNFSSTRTFYTPGCTVPTNLLTTNLTTTSAQLNWSFAAANADTRYQARYRALGATDWISLDNLTSSNGAGYTVLNGLSSGTAYEWQIRTLCSVGESSSFSGSVTFSTPVPCSGMYTLKSGSWSDVTVWSCNRLPVGSDVVELKHVVNLPAGYVGTAQRLQFFPGITLTYGADARLRLGF
ncbi:fibronectin type III domain-containing protein [Spirosoma sp. BT702]|uniref:Fibronectin type III domain-containing protein n=1 Tax=Spirosoma profusum TaxID=2771354 RepID=A0A926Y436_9BACT|nr:fibronectin type III domain-containing protein [Spirosoma profusum]MBD2702665.1 fibronectin type III domain-containing protein [Spirosoma profusum]